MQPTARGAVTTEQLLRYYFFPRLKVQLSFESYGLEFVESIQFTRYEI